VDGLDGAPDDLLQDLQQLEQGHPLPEAHVEDAPGRARRRSGLQVGVDHVVDVREVTALQAVAVDARRLAVQEGLDEAGNDGGIGGIRALPRTEDVEVAQGHALQVEAGSENAAEVLSMDLVGRIGALGVGQHGLVLGEFESIPVGTAGSGIDHPTHSGHLGPEHDVQRPTGVHLEGRQRILDAPGNGGHGALMEDHLHPLAGPHYRVAVPQILFQNLDSGLQVLQVLTMPRGEVVQDADLVSGFDEGVGEVRSDETGATGHEALHDLTSRQEGSSA